MLTATFRALRPRIAGRSSLSGESLRANGRKFLLLASRY